MRKLLLISLLFITSVELSARIIKSHNIRAVLTEVKKHKKKKSLVAFDLDETLVVPNNKDQRGGDMWLQARVEHAISKGVNAVIAWDIMLPLYFEIQMDPHFSLKLVEGKETKNVVSKVQALADKTIGLTARAFPIEDTTIRLLEQTGISFVTSGHFDALPTQEKVFMFHGIPGGFKHGIFFAGSGNKGEALMALLKTCKYEPQIIIFIDDKIKNIQAVEKAVEAAGIEFVGILYTRLDKQKAEYKLHPDLV